MLCLGVVTGVLAPTAARATENVSSSYGVYCGVHRQEDSSSSSDDPAGVAFAGQWNSAAASPAEHLLSAGSTAVYPLGAPYGEDCEANTDLRDRLTVGAGSSGMADGAQVQVDVTVRLDSELDIDRAGGGDFIARARYHARTGLTSVDDCPPGPEGPACVVSVSFGASHEHFETGYQGEVDATAERQYSFTTNTGTDLNGYTDESDQADPQGTQVYAGTATLTVGHHYDLVSSVRLFTQAYDQGGLRARATVPELSFSLTPVAGFEGVDLAWASAGGSVEPEDTVAPEVTAAVSPQAVGAWHTTAPTVAFSATDTASGVASITYRSTGALETAPTVVDGDVAELTVGSDGVTDVFYRATDLAGNVSDEKSLTVRLDRTAPVLAGVADLTATATGPAGAVVRFPLTASDDLGGPVTTVCTPADGSNFPVGTTAVTCTATDEAGNATTATFAVTVTAAPAPAIDRLGDAVAATRSSSLLTRVALNAAYRAADGQFDAHRTQAGCALLRAMDAVVVASSRSIPTVDATKLRTLIGEARAENGC
jgi:hypothetical protein